MMMHSQNCSFLPSKNQSAFSNSLPYNMDLGLLRNISTLIKSNSSTIGQHIVNLGLCEDKKTKKCYSKSLTSMDCLYSFSDFSSIGQNIRDTNSDRRMLPGDLDNLFSKHSPVTQRSTSMPSLSSHLVGGFVGSESHIEKRTDHKLEGNMWDMVKGLVDKFKVSSSSINKPTTSLNSSVVNISTDNEENLHCAGVNLSMYNTGFPVAGCSTKQSYAEVTKTKLDPSQNDEINPKSNESYYIYFNNQSDSNSGSPSEQGSSGNIERKSRSASECTNESEDSFIVFEHCEGDDLSTDDDESTTTDDESLLEFELSLEEWSTDDDEGTPSKQYTDINDKKLPKKKECSIDDAEGTSSKQYTAINDKKLSQKKVHFAEGKDFKQVRKLLVWDYASRVARMGQWDMLARDTVRFENRIVTSEEILSPILNLEHRYKVYQQRFASSQEGN